MTTVKVCTTGNTDFTKFEVFNHSAGCECFAGSSLTPCYACEANEYPRYYRVTLAGFSNSSCNECGEWNGTYVLEVPFGTFISVRCGVAMGLPCEPHHNPGLVVQMVEGTQLSRFLNMWGDTVDFWDIADVVAKGHYYLWVSITNNCNQWPTYFYNGLPDCGYCSDDGFMGLLYLLDLGTETPDCLQFGPVGVPLIRTTGNKDLSVCSRAWDKCTIGTVEVGSL